MSLKSTYIKNSFFNVSGWAWAAALSIFTTPYIFHKLGYEQYGILSLVLNVLGYFAFLDFGLGDAVIRFVAHYHASADYKKINKIVSSILLLFVSIGFLGCLSIILFTKYVAIDLFKISPNLKMTAMYCFYIGGVGFFFNLIFAVLSKIPEAIQRFDVSNSINVAIGTFVNLANVTVLFFGLGLKALVIVNLMGSFIGIFVFYIFIKKIMPGFKLSIYFSLKDMREVFSFGLFTLFTRFSNIFSQSINQLIVGIVLGPGGVTILNIPTKLTSRLQTFIFKMSYAVFPLTSQLSAQKDLSKVENIYLKLSRYVYIISSIFFVTLIAYSGSILKFWIGADFSSKACLPMEIISLALYIVSMTMVPSLIAVGMGKPKYNALFSFIGTMINIILVYPLTKKYGIAGSAFSFLIGSLNSPFFIYSINKGLLQMSNSKYFITVFAKITILNVCCVLFFKFFERIFIHNLISFILVVVFSMLLMTLLLGWYGLLQQDKELAANKIRYFATKLGFAR